MERLSWTDPIWVIILVSAILFTPSVSQEEGENVGKRRERQVFREDVSPLLAGGKVPSFAFDWTRLMFNNLDSRGISMPDGMTFSADRLQDGRSNEKRLILFRDDELVPRVPSTYTLRHPVQYPLYPNPKERPDSFLTDQRLETDSFGYCSGSCHFPRYDGERGNANLRAAYDDEARRKGVLYGDDISRGHLSPAHFSGNQGTRYIKNAVGLKSSHLWQTYKKPHVLFRNFHGPPIKEVEVHLVSPLANMHDYYYQKRMVEELLLGTEGAGPGSVSYFVYSSDDVIKPKVDKANSDKPWKHILGDLLRGNYKNVNRRF